MPHILIHFLRRSSLNRFAVLLLAAFSMAGLHAETPCPANVKSVPFTTARQHQTIVKVAINHAPPADFLLDTGTTMTVLDQSLAAELHIATLGNAKIAGVSVQGGSKFAKVDTLQLGDHLSTHVRVLVLDLSRLQRTGFAIRGLLGADILSRFDVLIDNAHNVLCIDDTGALQASIAAHQNPKGNSP